MTEGETTPGHVRILDVRTTRLHFRLLFADPRLPMRLDLRCVQPEFARVGPGFAVFTVAYDLDLRDGADRHLAEIGLSLAVPCATGPGCGEQQLVAFAGATLLALLHDYLREHLHWTTAQMGLPPLIIEPFRQADADIVTRATSTRSQNKRRD